MQGAAARRLTFASYRYKARIKNRAFTLTLEEFLSITKQNCYLCLAPPSNVRRKTGYAGVYVYNGVDRVDSKHGYHSWNVRPCCAKCNSMKSDLALDEFMLRVTNIFKLHAARSLLLSNMKREANGKHPSLGTPKKGNRRRKKP
jgi:hypothetical protein